MEGLWPQGTGESLARVAPRAVTKRPKGDPPPTVRYNQVIIKSQKGYNNKAARWLTSIYLLK